jgi:hypothetical protein
MSHNYSDGDDRYQPSAINQNSSCAQCSPSSNNDTKQVVKLCNCDPLSKIEGVQQTSEAAPITMEHGECLINPNCRRNGQDNRSHFEKHLEKLKENKDTGNKEEAKKHLQILKNIQQESLFNSQEPVQVEDQNQNIPSNEFNQDAPGEETEDIKE